MHNWKIVLTSNGDTLGEISTQHRIFQGHSFFPLLFIIIFISLSKTLNSTNYGYLLLKETPINHLLFMDDLKLHGKTKHELKSLVHTVRVISKDFDMEFGLDNVVWCI